MPHRSRYPLLLVASVVLLTGLLGAGSQPPPPLSAEQALDELRSQAGSRFQIGYHSRTGKVSFLSAGAAATFERAPGVTAFSQPETAAGSFLNRYGALFGLYNAPAQLRLDRQTNPGQGRAVLRYQQVHQGVPVVGGELRVQVGAGAQVLEVNGEILPDAQVPDKPAISAAGAESLARERAAAEFGYPVEDLAADPAQLWIYDPVLIAPGDGPTSLVWRTQVSHRESAPLRALVLVNAVSGRVELIFNQVDTAWVAPEGTPPPPGSPTAEPARAEATQTPGFEGPTLEYLAKGETSLGRAQWIGRFGTNGVDYYDLALDEARGWLYASDLLGGEIDVYSLDTLQLSHSIPVPGEAWGMDISPDGTELAVAVRTAGVIAFVDLDSQTVSDTFDVPDGFGQTLPWDLVYGRPGRLYTVADYSGDSFIRVIDTVSRAQVGISAYVSYYRPRIMISPDRNSLYITESKSGYALIRFNITSDTPVLLRQAGAGGYPGDQWEIHPTDGRVFLGTGKVFSADLATLEMTFPVTGYFVEYLPAMVESLAVGKGNQLMFLRLSDYSLRATWTFNYDISRMAATSDGSALYIDSEAGLLRLDLDPWPPLTYTPTASPTLPYGPPLLQTYTANNQGYLPGTLLCTSLSPSCVSGDTHVQAAHSNARAFYDYYHTVNGRDSIDNAGAPIISTVRFSRNYANAYWNGTQVVYGDYYPFPMGEDVVAHELTHGVTESESNLFYFYQSGAINESLSDAWGEFVDQIQVPGNDVNDGRWMLGEDVPGLGAIRYMMDPPMFHDPDRMGHPYYWKMSDDNWGVHINSGVNNKAVALIAEGGIFNGQTIAGIGINKTAALYYEVQTNLLTSGSDYLDLANALEYACQLLHAQGVLTASDCAQVGKAVTAVEMRLQPTPGFNEDAMVCPAPLVPRDIHYDTLEAGPDSWSFQSESWNGTSWSYDEPEQFWTYGIFAHSGRHYLLSAKANDGEACKPNFAVFNPVVLVPQGAYLWFAHAFMPEMAYYSGGLVEYTTDGGASWIDAGPLMDQNGYSATISPGMAGCSPDNGKMAFAKDTHGYISTRLNLAPLAGQAAQFRWRYTFQSSGGYNGNWWLDDVRVYTCGGPYRADLPMIATGP